MGASRAAGGYAGKWLWSEKRSYDAHCCCRFEMGEFSSRLRTSPSTSAFLPLELAAAWPVPAASSSTAAPAAKAVQVNCRWLRVMWLPFRCSSMFLLVAEVVCLQGLTSVGPACIIWRLQNIGWKERGGPTNILLLFLMGRTVQFSLSFSFTTLASRLKSVVPLVCHQMGGKNTLIVKNTFLDFDDGARLHNAAKRDELKKPDLENSEPTDWLMPLGYSISVASQSILTCLEVSHTACRFRLFQVWATGVLARSQLLKPPRWVPK